MSIPKENIPSAAMIYDAKQVRTAKPGEVRELLTYTCCSMDADEAWETRRKEMGDNGRKSNTYEYIKSMVEKAAVMRETLTPFPSRM